MASISVLLASIAILFAALYFYIKHKHSYWAKKGVKHDKTNLLFGNLTEIFAMKKNIFQFIHEQYFKYPNEKLVGFYGFTTPMVIVRDLDIIKDICVKDFNSFVNRSFHPDKDGDPMGHELMLRKWDDAWRGMRKKTSFAFSSARIKKMYPMVTKVGDDINKLFTEAAQKGDAKVDIRNFSTRYTVDVITSCGFGFQAGAIKAPDQSVMFKILSELFNFNIKQAIASNLMFFQHKGIYHYLSRYLGIKLFSKEVEHEVYEVVDISVKQRLQSEERRGDIFDEIVFSDAPEFEGLIKKAGAAMTMLIGGSETSSTTIVFALYELAKHPEIQRKLQREIRENLKKHNGEIPYEVLKSMEYLDQVVKESLRMYPVLPFLDRIATKDYRISGTNITIAKGTAVFIPMRALQLDPQYFPEPETFKPERFSQDEGHTFPEMAYLPFGAGPRHCMGKRFGNMTVKTFLVHFLKDFDIHPTEESRQPLRWNKRSFSLTLENGMSLAITPSKPVLIG